MDSRWIGTLLGIGWVLVTLGVWGASGQIWWIWPLSMGLACLASGGVYLWAAVQQLRSPKIESRPAPTRVGASLP